MSTAKMIVVGAIMLVILAVAQNCDCADLPIRPARPVSFKNDAEVKEYMQKLMAFVDKGANRYGKRNTFPIVDIQGIEQSSEEIVDQPLIKEYPESPVQHSQHRYYPEWMKQLLSRPNKRMWY